MTAYNYGCCWTTGTFGSLSCKRLLVIMKEWVVIREVDGIQGSDLFFLIIQLYVRIATCSYSYCNLY